MDRPISWERHSDFVSPSFDPTAGGICARVTILNTPIPKFSMVFGWMFPNGELKFHIPQDLNFSPTEASDILTKAQGLIKSKLAEVEQLRLLREAEDKKRADEERERKSIKKKRYEDNQQRRADENRQRASRSGKKG